jgi:putative flippase GtrA
MRQLNRFFIGTLIGLAVDFGVYFLGLTFGLAPGYANAVSSVCAVIVTYFISTKYTFGVRIVISGFVFYCAWYALSIVGFSVVVQLLHDSYEFPAFWAKVVTLPVSFVLNFCASRLILSRAKPAITAAAHND